MTNLELFEKDFKELLKEKDLIKGKLIYFLDNNGIDNEIDKIVNFIGYIFNNYYNNEQEFLQNKQQYINDLFNIKNNLLSYLQQTLMALIVRTSDNLTLHFIQRLNQFLIQLLQFYEQEIYNNKNFNSELIKLFNLIQDINSIINGSITYNNLLQYINIGIQYLEELLAYQQPKLNIAEHFKKALEDISK